MGDFFERIVDVEVSGEDAGALAERMVEWMVGEGLIIRELSGDGVYSLTVDEGYLPGPNWQRAVEDPGWEPGPVAVVVGREYHVGGQGEDTADSATCPRCDGRVVIIDYPESFEPDDEAWRPFRDAIAGWKETGEGSAACPACGAQVPVTAWQFGSGFDLGALAFDFWGWPPLGTGFQAEFARQLGHRTEVQEGKF
ncbi:hypothetical protein [Streptomyces sp. NBC_01465]|uniref:hypothetical protein n=1 Tax=Streptomyces sp. NBC_01465 TaxID=2903878 RepID=UPI002E30326C|nr:hypothetical protein [Streptomyces sp. NBC_01465]